MTTRFHSNVLLALSAMMVLFVSPASADEPPPAAPEAAAPDDDATPADAEPTVEHAPVGSVPAYQDFVLRAVVTSAHKLAEVHLHLRHVGDSTWRTLRFDRDGESTY